MKEYEAEKKITKIIYIEIERIRALNRNYGLQFSVKMRQKFEFPSENLPTRDFVLKTENNSIFTLLRPFYRRIKQKWKSKLQRKNCLYKQQKTKKNYKNQIEFHYFCFELVSFTAISVTDGVLCSSPNVHARI